MGGRTMEGLTGVENLRRVANTGPPPLTNIAKGLTGGSAIEELTKMVRYLQIAQAQRDNRGLSLRPNSSMCIEVPMVQ